VNPRRRRLLAGVVLIVAGTGTAAALALKAFRENLLYFYSPSQVVAGEAPVNRPFRIGGLVEEGSVARDPESLAVRFVLTDTLKGVEVTYTGVLPDLFREGQGIVANGRLTADGRFEASQVLAKHDENYMPPEVAEALTRAGKSIPHEAFRGSRDR
jgi:cytochrome c-type biogenesis protein CcmE